MKGGSHIPDQADDMDGTKEAHADPFAQVESDGHQQYQIETYRAEPHPQRPVGRDEGDQDLQQRIGQVAVHQQHPHVYHQKGDRQQGNELMKVIREKSIQQLVEGLC